MKNPDSLPPGHLTAGLGADELKRRLEVAWVTNRRLNRRCQSAEKHQDDLLRHVVGLIEGLKRTADRAQEYARDLRGYACATHREYCLASYGEATLKYRIVALDQEVLRLRSDSSKEWGRRLAAEDEVRRLQAENHTLRMRIDDLEKSQSVAGR